MPREVSRFLCRWHNQLDPQFSNENWTKEEEEVLFSYHNEVGNKWAKISTYLPGRTDNYVKNHFYSTLRKAVRRANKFLADIKDRELREIKNVLLNKILACAEDKFENRMDVSEEVVELCIEIKNKLIPFANLNDLSAEEETSLRELLALVVRFTKVYRKKRPKKKKKKVDIMEEDLHEEIPRKEPSRSRVSRHSLLPDFIPAALPTTPSCPLSGTGVVFGTTVIQNDMLPEFLRNKLMNASQEMIFDSPMPCAGLKLFDADNSRVLFPSNNFCSPPLTQRSKPPRALTSSSRASSRSCTAPSTTSGLPSSDRY